MWVEKRFECMFLLIRRREDSMQEHRGSFLATPTAELSTQEEMLLGDILDWSLDTSCSGYEGDRESEGEKDGESEWGGNGSYILWIIVHKNNKTKPIVIDAWVTLVSWHLELINLRFILHGFWAATSVLVLFL